MEIPFDVEAVFGSKRPKVKALIQGIEYSGTLVLMGTECHILGIRREMRERSAKPLATRLR